MRPTEITYNIQILTIDFKIFENRNRSFIRQVSFVQGKELILDHIAFIKPSYEREGT